MNSPDKSDPISQEFNPGNAFFVDNDACVIQLTGRDCHKFLNNFCTADIQNLGDRALTEAFVLDPKGKTISFVLILSAEKGLQIVVPKTQRDILVGHLSKYVVIEDVFIEEMSNAIIVYLSWPVPGSVPTHIGPDIFLGVFADSIPQDLTREKIEVDKTAFERIRVENRFPKSGVDVLPDNLAQEFGRNKTAISFNKGCYLGQETVARLDALGHTNRVFCLATIDSRENPRANSELTSDKQTVGTVTSSAWSPRFGSYAVLAMVKKPFHKPGTALMLGQNKATIR